MRRFRSWIVIVLAGVIAACASSPSPSPFTGFFRGYDTCRDEYARMDERVDAAGVRVGTFWRVPGYPYLRTDRLLASFGPEVKGLNDVSEWLRRMRELDQEARDYEYINLGMNDLEIAIQRDRFLNCGRTLAAIELDDERQRHALLDVVVPEDAYSTWRRVLGLHALMTPSLRERIELRHAQAQAQWQQVVPATAAMQLWRASPREDLQLLNDVGRADMQNALGYPQLFDSQWRALAERHAPILGVENDAESEGPAMPAFTAEQRLVGDTAQPRLHYQIGFTRFGKDLLVQITYVAWFKAGPKADHVPIDGLIWRVTLDRQFEPMLYESLHGSGLDHRWYPVQALARRVSETREPQFIAPELAPARDVVLSLGAGTHEVRRVLALDARPSRLVRSYELRPYEDLYTLPVPGGHARSLFNVDGLMTQSAGSDPIAGFASGIRQPGALRQLGHLAIAHIDKQHFDDPRLLEALFQPQP